MANVDSKLGLRPIEGQNLRLKIFPVNAADSGAALFKNSPVKLVASGGVAANSTDSVNFVGTVLDLYDSNKVPVSYLTASTDGYVGATTNPNLRYQIQCSGTLTASSVGDCANLIATAGDMTLGQSRYELSSTLLGASAPGQMRIIGLVDRPDNAWGAQNDVVVIAAHHAFMSTPVGV